MVLLTLVTTLKQSKEGSNYFTNGAACSVVEIDCLTGDYHVLKTDIVMDVGKSLNPAIDIGQIEGAFVQGYGLFVMEQMIHSLSVVPFTRGPGAYKIPGFDDIPAEFNVTLLKGMQVYLFYSIHKLALSFAMFGRTGT